MKKYESMFLFAMLPAFLGSLVVPTPAAAADWPQVGFDPQRRACTPDTAAPPYKLLWEASFPGERIHRCACAVTAGGKVFIGAKSGVMRALDLLDKGRELWSFKCDGPILHSAAAAGGKVIFASLDGCVYALNAADGALAWKADTGFGFSNAPLIAEDSVMIGNRAGVFFRLGLADGGVIWKRDFGAPVFQTAAYNDGRVYVGAEDMVMRALSAADGTELWRSGKLQGQSFKDYWPVAHKGCVIVRPMVLSFEFEVYTGFPPLTAYPDERVFVEATQSRPAGKPLPEAYAQAQDRLCDFYRDNPSYQEIYFLNESDGKSAFIAPLVRAAVLGGPTPPPCALPDGGLAVPLVSKTYRWGCFDIDGRRLVDIWPTDGFHGQVAGNADETRIAVSSGPFVLIADWTGMTGCFDTRTRAWAGFPGGRSHMPYFSSLVTGGTQPVVTGNIVLHTLHSVVVARGQGGQSSHLSIVSGGGSRNSQGDE